MPKQEVGWWSISRERQFIDYRYIGIGKIRPGGTIVEGTAGNTGIGEWLLLPLVDSRSHARTNLAGLAHVCRSRGYKCVIYMPNVGHSSLPASVSDPVLHALQTQSQEKIDLLRMLGAEVHPVPGEFFPCLRMCYIF